MSDEDFDEIIEGAGGEGAFMPEGDPLRKLPLFDFDTEVWFNDKTLEPAPINPIHLHVKFRYNGHARDGTLPDECLDKFHIFPVSRDDQTRYLSEWLQIPLGVEGAQDIVDALTEAIEEVQRRTTQ